MRSISQLSREYLPVTVSASDDGQPYNPTADLVEFAFTPAGTSTQPSTWYAGEWDSTTANPGTNEYTALCLIGPGGTAVLTPARYDVWLRITDNPERPVVPAGQVAIT